MNLYNHKRILLDGKTVYANSVDLTTTANITPVYINQDITNTFSVDSYVKNTFSINYLLEGADPLFDRIYDHKRYITGDFCGIVFKSGLIESYNLKIAANAPIEVSAVIAFWGGTGLLQQNNNWRNEVSTRPVSFTGNPTDVNAAYALNGSGVYFQHIEGVNIPNLNPSEITWSFSADSAPVLHAGTLEPKDFNFTNKQSNISITLDSYTGLINVSGEKTSFYVHLRNISGTNVMTVPINGYIYQRSFSATPDSVFGNKFSILQANLANTFSLSSLGASTVYANEELTINGENLKQVKSVKLGSQIVNPTLQTDSLIKFRVPYTAKTAKVYLTNDSQTVESSTVTVADSGILISGLNKISGSYYSETPYIDIVGTGLYNIDKIYFGSGECFSYEVITNSLVRAQVPSGATYDLVRIQSTDRNLNGYSPFKFVPIPYPLGYTGRAFLNQVVTFTGDNLSGVTGISFNNLPTVTAFRLASDNGINKLSTYLPSGNSRGYVKFYTQSGVTATSNFYFEPTIFISGINALSGTVGSTLRITGHSLIPQLMDYAGMDDYYYVKIGESDESLFGKISNYVLTGLVPTSATTGPVRILGNNGSEYAWSGIFTVLPSVQTIYGVGPYDIEWGQETRVTGINFFNIINVEYTDGLNPPYEGTIGGYKVALDGRSISIPSTGIADYVSGSAVVQEYGIRITSSQGVASYSSAFQISDYKIPGDAGFVDTVSVVNLVSGLDADQSDSFTLDNNTDYDQYYTIPRLSGFNYYSPISGFAYNVGRELYVPAGASKTLNIYTSGSGEIYARTLTGKFRTTDGYTKDFFIEISPI